MNPQEFVMAFAEAFGEDVQLPIAFGCHHTILVGLCLIDYNGCDREP